MSARNLDRRLSDGLATARTLERAGVAIVRPHDARHTTATLTLGQGVHPKLVSEMLGHSIVAITLDLYSHATAAMHRRR